MSVAIHLYAHCWNEEAMLPHFFRHYDALVDEYTIYDTGSTDRSLEMLRAHPRVRLVEAAAEGDSFVQENTARQNTCWKDGRGRADWVIITAVDEFLHHPDLRGFLAEGRDRGVTIVRAEGYEMIADDFPEGDAPLAARITSGARDRQWLDKIQAFDPNRIKDINYEAGRHTAQPTGHVVWAEPGAVKLLHYKHLGLAYVLARYRQLRTGLRTGDVSRNLGSHYLWDAETIGRRFDDLKKASVKVL